MYIRREWSTKNHQQLGQKQEQKKKYGSIIISHSSYFERDDGSLMMMREISLKVYEVCFTRKIILILYGFYEWELTEKFIFDNTCVSVTIQAITNNN